MPDIFAETLPIDENTTLDSLISEIHARAMRRGVAASYLSRRPSQAERSHRAGQQVQAGSVRFYLFAAYLQEDRVKWLMEVKDKLPESDPDRVDPAKLPELVGEDLQIEVKPWHGLFYVWLYLVPTDDVALLRHQFRKTRALEGKAADAKSDETLIEIDRLMGLICSVFRPASAAESIWRSSTARRAGNLNQTN